MKYIKILSVLAGAALFSFSCTKLDENLRDSLSAEDKSVNAAGLLQSAYETLNNPFMNQEEVWGINEHTTDETIGPTRAGDWDDNGVWRVLHAHTWNADHAFIRNTFRELLQAQFSATSVLYRNPSPKQAAEARYIRALSTFFVLDGFDQVPYRLDLSDYGKLPLTIRGSAAADTIIKELNLAIPDLDQYKTIGASKDAARALLMKVYLNRGVYKKRDAPTFDPTDMDQVISLADQILSSSAGYTLNPSYFQTFAYNNSVANKEVIYSLENTPGTRGGPTRTRWFCTLHYKQKPSGWNGFATLADFYDKFDAADVRRGVNYPGFTDKTGTRVGFLIGQQFDENGVALTDRKGNALSFTRKVALKETGNDLEITGIRVLKYVPDIVTSPDGGGKGDIVDNEYVIFRFADVILMKAEALLRKGQTAAAITEVNKIRAIRGVPNFATLTLDDLLDERGREMYWEGWRRNDLIRFGKFLNALPAGAGTTSTRPTKSGIERLLFPIPNQQLAVNSNLEQNPGYN